MSPWIHVYVQSDDFMIGFWGISFFFLFYILTCTLSYILSTKTHLIGDELTTLVSSIVCNDWEYMLKTSSSNQVSINLDDF